MLDNDFSGNPWFAEKRCRFMMTENLGEKLLAEGMIFFPPPANGGHIMGGGAHHREIGRIAGVIKYLGRVFGHALNFEAENAELAHHPGH